MKVLMHHSMSKVVKVVELLYIVYLMDSLQILPIFFIFFLIVLLVRIFCDLNSLIHPVQHHTNKNKTKIFYKIK